MARFIVDSGSTLGRAGADLGAIGGRSWTGPGLLRRVDTGSLPQRSKIETAARRSVMDGGPAIRAHARAAARRSVDGR